MAELELNKIVGMIMENPELVEKIKAMGNAAKESDTAVKEAAEPTVEVPAQSFTPRHSKRTEILRSLETFLSEERKKSLETMITIADILDNVKRKEI
jgi:hypothetical protein